VSRLHDHVAAELERAAAALRAGEATVYGYAVRSADGRESGAVAYGDRWLEFVLEQSDGDGPASPSEPEGTTAAGEPDAADETGA
jgi:hypothetical protein